MKKVKLSIYYQGIRYESLPDTVKDEKEFIEYQRAVRNGLNEGNSVKLNTKEGVLILSHYILERSIIRIIEVE
jgi:hypothetical protein